MGMDQSIWEGELYFHVNWFIFCCFLEEHMGTSISVFSALCPQTVTPATAVPILNLDTPFTSYEINAKIYTNSEFFSNIKKF